jgi:ankyrin repeat protein
VVLQLDELNEKQKRLAFYIKKNNVDKVESILSSGLDVNLGYEGQSFMFLAISELKNPLAICQLLLSHGAFVSHTDATQDPLLLATKKNDTELISLLQEYGASYGNQLEGTEQKVLEQVLFSKQEDLIDNLLYSYEDEERACYLVLDAIKSQEENWLLANLTQQLLSFRTLDYRTIIMKLIEEQELKKAKFILTHFDLDLEMEDELYRTALFYLCQSKKHDEELLRVMIEQGIDFDFHDQTDQTPLMHAIRYGNEALAKALVHYGADCNAVNGEERSVLMYAAQYASIDLFRFLVDAGADTSHQQVLKGTKKSVFDYITQDRSEKVFFLNRYEKDLKEEKLKVKPKVTKGDPGDRVIDWPQVLKIGNLVYVSQIFRFDSIIREKHYDKLSNRVKELSKEVDHQLVVDYLLLIGIKESNVEVIDRALNLGANVEAQYDDGDHNTILSQALKKPFIYAHLLGKVEPIKNGKPEPKIKSPKQGITSLPKSLLDAILYNDGKAVEKQLKDSKYLYMTDQEGMTPALYALKYKQTKVFNLLMKHHQKDDTISPLLKKKLKKMVNLLLDMGNTEGLEVSEFISSFRFYLDPFIEGLLYQEFTGDSVNANHNHYLNELECQVSELERLVKESKTRKPLKLKSYVLKKIIDDRINVEAKQVVKLLEEKAVEKEVEQEIENNEVNIVKDEVAEEVVCKHENKEDNKKVKQLQQLSHLIELNEQDDYFYALYDFLSECESSFVKLLNLDVVNENGDSLLIKAINKEDTRMVERLLTSSIDINIRNQKGLTALMYACINKNAKLVKQLMDYGATLDLFSHEGYNALMYAIKFNDQKSVKILIEQGAKFIDENEGDMPIVVAYHYNREMIDYLVQLIGKEDLIKQVEASPHLSRLVKEGLLQILKKDEKANSIKKTADGRNKIFVKKQVQLLDGETEEFSFYLIVDESEDHISAYRILLNREGKCIPIRLANKTAFVNLTELFHFKYVSLDHAITLKKNYQMILNEFVKGNHEINELNLDLSDDEETEEKGKVVTE